MLQQELNLNSTVGEWVARHPSTARIFERLGIDYCCGGQRPLEDACRNRRLATEDVVDQLDAVIQSTDGEGGNWDAVSLTELCDHIEQTHHAYLRSELPRLTALVDKVVQAHGGSHPELRELQAVFAALRGELEPHMFKEERILFPAIRVTECADAPPQFPFGSLGNPIDVMEDEHEHTGQALARIRTLTRDFRVPEGACNTYRVMLDGLRELEADMHQHVHKENNILFPRAAEQEVRAASLQQL